MSKSTTKIAITEEAVNAMTADEQWSYHENRSTRGPRDRWYFGGFKKPSKCTPEAPASTDPKETTVNAKTAKTPTAPKSKSSKKETTVTAAKPNSSTKITTAQRNAEAPKGQKWCPRHEAYEPVGDFAKNKAAKDGLFAVCKRAEADDRRRWKAEREASAPAKAVAAKAAKVSKARAAKVAAIEAGTTFEEAPVVAPAASAITYSNPKYLPGRTFTDEAEFNAAMDAAKAAAKAEAEAPIGSGSAAAIRANRKAAASEAAPAAPVKKARKARKAA